MTMPRYAISSGHGKYVRGAAGPSPWGLDEVDEVRKQVDRIAEILRHNGCEVATFHDNVSHDVNTNLSTICAWHNNQVRDYDVSCHLNASAPTSQPVGTEVFYYSQAGLAGEISNAIAQAGGFRNRGPKQNKGLYFLSHTDKPAVLLESCFVDSQADCDLWRKNWDAIQHAIAEAMAGETLELPEGGGPPERPERPPEEHPEDPLDVPLEDRPVLGKGDEGEHVFDLQELLPHFQGDIDGDFGSITEQAVIDYQRSRGLAADGLVGEQTWTALYENRLPLPPPPHALSLRDIERICALAMESDITTYHWEDRGVAPPGCIQGFAVTFAQTYLKLKAGHPAAVEMSKARTNSDKDALNVYQGDFLELARGNNVAGIEVLISLYALMLGHAMRESNGKHCCGRDQSADNVQSDTCEAGLLQHSYNSHGATDPEFTMLMDEYSNPRNQATCYLDIWANEVSCSDADWDCYGSGSGYAFQKLAKSCPAFAVESGALVLRKLCNHFGPIIRKEVELKADAVTLFEDIRNYVDDNMTGVQA